MCLIGCKNFLCSMKKLLCLLLFPSLVFAQDGAFWKFLAYCAGTGGSCLIIGSAAGVAIMGILKIDFIWYLKNISGLAFAGYIAGAGTYYVMFAL